MAEKKLEVKDLKISFRTNGGKVQAVRDISFDLYKGETLAIIGESGSGKSVTSRAIMGILAGNSIVEGGSIVYDGQDLLKIKEEDFHKIRGDRIAMIFQDPMSSLNPIVKVGKQLTEAMILKGKASQKRSRKEFNSRLKLLGEYMKASYGDSLSQEQSQKIDEMIKTFNAFCISATKIESAYNSSKRKIEESIRDIKDIFFFDEKKQYAKLKEDLGTIVKNLDDVYNVFLVDQAKSPLVSYVATLKTELRALKKNAPLSEATKEALKAADVEIKKANERLAPNFFRIGYYIYRNPDFDLASMPIDELNEMALRYLDQEFLGDFIKEEEKALAYANQVATEKKAEAIKEAEKAIAAVDQMLVDKKTFSEMSKPVLSAVAAAINPLDIVKDNTAYTFPVSLKKDAQIYFSAIKGNPKEEKRYAKQKAKFDAIVAKGKVPDWGVIPLSLVDQKKIRDQILVLFAEIKADFEKRIEEAPAYVPNKNAIALIDYFKELASAVVYRVTPALAKLRAINLLEEVGIAEPKARYNQYPFEFSGGMRQRIVIAIALSANPDILICDEPTTALDVTIQSQILELINRLKAERNLSVIFITHDLGVVANMADKIAVMYAGKIVETGSVDEIFYDPRHPYTWALLSSMPDLDTNEKLEAIPGTPPNMIYPPVGDAFAERNKYAMQIDFEQQPPMFQVSETHYAATWLLHPDAPKVDPPKIVTDRIERMKKAGGEQNG